MVAAVHGGRPQATATRPTGREAQVTKVVLRRAGNGEQHRYATPDGRFTVYAASVDPKNPARALSWRVEDRDGKPWVDSQLNPSSTTDVDRLEDARFEIARVLERPRRPSGIDDPAELARLAAADALPDAEQEGRYADFVDMAEELWGDVDTTVAALARFCAPLPLLDALASRYRAERVRPLANPDAETVCDTWNANRNL